METRNETSTHSPAPDAEDVNQLAEPSGVTEPAEKLVGGAPESDSGGSIHRRPGKGETITIKGYIDRGFASIPRC